MEIVPYKFSFYQEDWIAIISARIKLITEKLQRCNYNNLFKLLIV